MLPNIRLAMERVTAFHAHLELTEIIYEKSRMTAHLSVVRAREQTVYRVRCRYSQSRAANSVPDSLRVLPLRQMAGACRACWHLGDLPHDFAVFIRQIRGIGLNLKLAEEICFGIRNRRCDVGCSAGVSGNQCSNRVTSSAATVVAKRIAGHERSVRHFADANHQPKSICLRNLGC